MHRIRTSQVEHDDLVRRGAQALIKYGWRATRAALREWPQPMPVASVRTGRTHVPDISARRPYQDVQAIFEVETPESLYDEHTADQWSTFASYAAAYEMEFFIVIPEGSREDVEIRLSQLGIIDAEIWEV